MQLNTVRCARLTFQAGCLLYLRTSTSIFSTGERWHLLELIGLMITHPSIKPHSFVINHPFYVKVSGASGPPGPMSGSLCSYLSTFAETHQGFVYLCILNFSNLYVNMSVREKIWSSAARLA